MARSMNIFLVCRLFWFVAFTLATITAAYFISNVYSKWDESPVIVSIGARTTSLKDIPFPAVTLCTVNKVRKSEADKINRSTYVISSS
jgi:amiloride-sensitive sodium channel